MVNLPLLATTLMPGHLMQLLSKTLSVSSDNTLTIARTSPPEMFLLNVFRKYAANLQENTHAKVQFQ